MEHLFVDEIFGNLCEFSGFFDEKFETGPGGVVAGPNRGASIGVGEKIVLIYCVIFVVFFADVFEVLIRRAVVQGHVVKFLVAVHVIDYHVPDPEIFESPHEVEIFTDGVEKNFLVVTFCHFLEILYEEIAAEFYVEN